MPPLWGNIYRLTGYAGSLHPSGNSAKRGVNLPKLLRSTARGYSTVSIHLSR